MISFSKSVYSMLSHPETLVVSQVVWVMKASEGLFSAEFGLTTVLPPPEDDFTPYSDLTEGLVLGWIDEHTPTERIQEAEAWLTQRIAEITAAQPVEQPLPWAPALAEVDPVEVPYDVEASLAAEAAQTG